MSVQSKWNGSLRFAELSFPVGLAATRNGKEDVTLSTLHRVCASPLVQVRECPVHGPVPEDELVKGWEAAPGEYVLVEKDELEAAFELPKERVLDVRAVVDRALIDPAQVRNTWYLIPGAGAWAAKGYVLIRGLLRARDAALVVRFPAWQVDQVAAVVPSPTGAALLVQKLAALDEVHSAAAIDERLKDVTIGDEEIELGLQLIDRRIGPLDPGVLVNEKRAAIRGLVEGKRVKGETVRAEQIHQATGAAASPAPVDLVDALRRSVKTSPRKRAAARRPVRA